MARTSPDEERENKRVFGRAVGWFALYWSIPTTVCLPFMARNVWPQTLRLPFHIAGTIFYLGHDLSFKSVRVFFLWFSFVLLVVIELARKFTDKENKRFIMRKAVLSRIYFGAFYTQINYQAGALLSDYRSCDEGFGSLGVSPCRITLMQNETGIMTVTSNAFETSTVVCAAVMIFWVYRAALKYVLIEREAETDPAHRLLQNMKPSGILLLP